MLTTDIKINIQRFGRFLSHLIMPNIGAFIAWGLITALFIEKGWLPNEHLAQLIVPMRDYLLPLLVGYTGGRLLGGERGGIIGAVATMGAIVGSQSPMFIGAMIAGPLAGYTLKHFDQLIEGKIKSGFEMLVNNFSLGIIGALLSLLAFFFLGPWVESFSKVLSLGIDFMRQRNLLPWIALLTEPAKVFFLNNAINHGIFSQMGIQKAAEAGHSLLFLIEANPGPGLGVLLAYGFFGPKTTRQSALGATIIHFFGGIHEIYFPYVLMRPRLLLAVIAGGFSGIATLIFFKAGLVSPPSPGSIIAIIGLTPPDSLLGVVTAISVATLVSFTIAGLLLKLSKGSEQRPADLGKTPGQTSCFSKDGSVINSLTTAIKEPSKAKIVVACDAGMGSSALGAGLLKKRVEAAGLMGVSVRHCAINQITDDVDIVITHLNLTPRAQQRCPTAEHLSLNHFIDIPFYDELVKRLLAQSQLSRVSEFSAPAVSDDTSITMRFQLRAQDVFLAQQATNKEQAIRFAGEQLVNNGYVKPAYIEAMLAREALASTYLGESIAVPHGTIEAKAEILCTGVVICQYPQGVSFGEQPDERARLVIGIAARHQEHMALLAQLTSALEGSQRIEALAMAPTVEDFLSLLNSEELL
jgi:mannitol PTS system EIICBA or EIICB component